MLFLIDKAGNSSRERAFLIGLFLLLWIYLAIRINLVGREPNGQVCPGAEYDKFCNWLTQELCAIVNDETGAPLVRNVRRMRELHPGPFADDVEDLVIEWNRDDPIRSVSSPRIGQLRARNPDARTGDHRPECLFVIRGRGISPGEIDHPVAVTDSRVASGSSSPASCWTTNSS